MLQTVMPELLNALERGEWQSVTMYVESGATETLINKNVQTVVALQDGRSIERV